MELKSNVKTLKFYVSNTDIVNHESVYETIAIQAKNNGLAGATIYKGAMGYGTSSNLRSDKFWEMNYKVPVIIEIIDKEDKINSFLDKILPWIKQLPKGCLVTCQDTDVILVKDGNTILK